MVSKTVDRDLRRIPLVILIETDDSLDSAIELLEQITLVGRVDEVPLEAEAEQGRGSLQDLLSSSDDGDAAASAVRHRIHSVNLLHGLGCRSVLLGAERGDEALAAVAELHLAGDALRGDCLEVLCEELGDLLAVLIGDEAHRNLGVGLRSDDGLRALGIMSAPDAVDIEAGTDRGALQSGVTLLSADSVDADSGLELLLAEGNLAEHLAVLAAELLDIVVETLDSDVAVLVDERRNHIAESLDRVVDGSAVVTGVDIHLGSADGYLHIGHSAHAGADGGNILGLLGGIGDEYGVAGEFALVGLDPVAEARGTDLLLALEQELDVVAEFLLLYEIFECLDVHETLALVVVRSAAPDGAVLDDGLVRVCLPQVERLCGLHVVVAVNQHGGKFRIDFLLGIDHRVARGLADFNLVGTGGLYEACELLGAAAHILLVLRIGTY